MIIDEADRSLHDALCVVRCLVKKHSIVPGGAAVEMEIAQKLMIHSREVFGTDQYCVRAYAEALEIVPYTLAENAGLDPILFVTQQRLAHKEGKKYMGLNVKKNKVANMVDAKVI